MIDRIKKNKKILTGLALFMVLALLLIAIHSWDEDTIKSMLKDKVTFVNLPNDDEEMLATIPKSAKLIANYSGRQNTISSHTTDVSTVTTKPKNTVATFPSAMATKR